MVREFVNKSGAFVKALTTDFSRLRYFVVFIGNPRSGTTLVRSLLDAHPEIVISNETNAMEVLSTGKNFRMIMAKIFYQSHGFTMNPTWTGYSYRIPFHSKGKQGTIKIIGDKKAGRTTKLFMKDMSLVDALQRQIPVPIRFIHCIRNPLDVITTKTKKNGRPLEWNIHQYFRIERTSLDVTERLELGQLKHIYLEKLIAEPEETIKSLLQFLDIIPDDDYINACRSVIFDKPQKRRFGLEWTGDHLSAVENYVKHFDHLAFYLDQGRLRFAETISQ